MGISAEPEKIFLDSTSFLSGGYNAKGLSPQRLSLTNAEGITILTYIISSHSKMCCLFLCLERSQPHGSPSPATSNVEKEQNVEENAPSKTIAVRTSWGTIPREYPRNYRENKVLPQQNRRKTPNPSEKAGGNKLRPTKKSRKYALFHTS
jgi:hypothetical protein